jgi:uncharacterized protein
MKTEIVYKPIRFFLVTFLITWVTGFLAAYFSYQEGMEGIQFLVMMPGMFAPLISVLIMIGGRENKELRKDFWSKLSLKRIKLNYLPVILLIMPFALFLATALSVSFGHTSNQFMLSSEFQIISGSTALTLFILFMAPTVEELGWRGYGVDSLRSKMDLFKTSMVFGVLWGLWHLPLFFIKGYYQHELWEMSIVYVINFFVQVFVASILMNWVYYKNNRSITASILFHFLFNLFSVLFQTEQYTKCIITVILLVISIVVIVQNKEFFFDEKKTILALSPKTE